MLFLCAEEPYGSSVYGDWLEDHIRQDEAEACRSPCLLGVSPDLDLTLLGRCDGGHSPFYLTLMYRVGIPRHVGYGGRGNTSGGDGNGHGYLIYNGPGSYSGNVFPGYIASFGVYGYDGSQGGYGSYCTADGHGGDGHEGGYGGSAITE